MTLWCPVALRILLFSLINDHDAVNIILTIASKDIEDESRKYHEENVDEYKKKGNQEWLTSLKEVHYDCVSSLDFNLSKCNLSNFQMFKFRISKFSKFQIPTCQTCGTYTFRSCQKSYVRTDATIFLYSLK